jgi:hypothetical protein
VHASVAPTIASGCYVSDGNSYRAIVACGGRHATLPLLFKPMGAPLPQPSYIASDADYVDYITELMGGFAVPSFVKAHRRGRRISCSACA